MLKFYFSGCSISDSNPDTVWKNIGSWLVAATLIKINPDYCLFHIFWQSNGTCCPKCLQRIESTTLVWICSLLHLMCVITHAHANTCATSLMHLKNSMHHLFIALIAWDIRTKKLKEQKHQIE